MSLVRIASMIYTYNMHMIAFNVRKLNQNMYSTIPCLGENTYKKDIYTNVIHSVGVHGSDFR